MVTHLLPVPLRSCQCMCQVSSKPRDCLATATIIGAFAFWEWQFWLLVPRHTCVLLVLEGPFRSRILYLLQLANLLKTRSQIDGSSHAAIISNPFICSHKSWTHYCDEWDVLIISISKRQFIDMFLNRFCFWAP